jgi:hypothetical protein
MECLNFDGPPIYYRNFLFTTTPSQIRQVPLILGLTLVGSFPMICPVRIGHLTSEKNAPLKAPNASKIPARHPE